MCTDIYLPVGMNSEAALSNAPHSVARAMTRQNLVSAFLRSKIAGTQVKYNQLSVIVKPSLACIELHLHHKV